MSADEDDIDAALYAAGGLTPVERDAAEARMKRDPAFAAAAGEWESFLAPLAGFAPPLSPGDHVLERLEARLDARARLEALSRTLDAPQAAWIGLYPGVRMQTLRPADALGRATVLLEFEPGAVFPAHAHVQDEEIYMIRGELTMGHVELGAGDYHVSPKGGGHPPSTTATGCLCIVCAVM